MQNRPLDGVRVVELAHVAAGPFAGMLLADLGADVVKVEPPAGDQMRAWPPFAVSDGPEGGERFSHNFASVNRNKRSVVADLKDPAQLREVRDLIAAADVLVENYRPGVLDRLGLGYGDVAHPGLVYCSISGYGLTSPYADDGAYDVVVQGMSGLMSVTGDPAEQGGHPVKAGVPVGDFTAGLYAAYTIVALLPQARSGEAVRVDVPMLDCLLGVSALQTSEYWGSGREPQRLGTAHPRNAPYQAFSAADGDFTVAAGNDRLWAAVAELTDVDAQDPRFLTQLDRVAHQRELGALLQERFRGEKRDHWITELKARGVPCGPVNTFGEILADTHTAPLVHELEIPVAGPTPHIAYPVRIEGLEPRLDRGAPRLGADREEVLDQWR